MHRASILSTILFLTLSLGLSPALTAAASDALVSLVEAERSFSRTSQQKGMRAAFLEFLAEGSIVFRPGPVDGIEATRAQPESEDTLEWWPKLAEIAASGDFGYTTGPWVYRLADGSRPPGHGQYFSFWKKTAAGEWKVAVDIGTFNPPPASALPDWADTAPVPRKWRASAGGEVLDARAELAAVEAREEAFNSALAAQGVAAAYRSFLTDDAVLLRNGSSALVRQDLVEQALAAESASLAWQRQRGDIAASADLAYTSGAYEGQGEGGEVSQKGHYLRAWRRLPDGSWKVAVDLLLPLPPAPPPPPEGAADSAAEAGSQGE